MIPRTIHYCWFGGGKRSVLIQQCIESWQRYMPEWAIVEWSEVNLPLDTDYLRAAHKRRLWAHISDFARLQALYTCGGVYLDTDVEVRKSLDSLRHDACFVGFQVKHAGPDWVNNAVLGAEEGHPFLADCLRVTLRHLEVTGRFARSPTVTTQVLRMLGLRRYGLQQIGSVTVYPTPYFYPYPWFAAFREDCITAETYSVHHWEGSWRKAAQAV